MFLHNANYFVDDRGSFCDVNGNIDFSIKRSYICTNFDTNVVRGFHYHKKEKKLFYVPKGTVKFIIWKLSYKQACELSQGVYNKIGAFNDPITFILTDNKPQVLYIPDGYANGWKALQNDTILVGYSNLDLNESIKDDIRIDPHQGEMFKKIQWNTEHR